MGLFKKDRISFLASCNFAIPRDTKIISKWNTKSNCLQVLNLKTGKWATEGKEFLDGVWDGVVIYTNDQTIRTEKTKILFLIIVFIVSAVIHITINYLDITIYYVLPLVVGFIISICMFWRKNISEIGIIEKICHQTSVTDCDAVENSSYASWNRLSMNNLALSFFFSQLICIIISFVSENNNIFDTIYLISVIVSIPITIYSIYGQVKVGKICPLCLMVLICVFSEAIIFMRLPIHFVNVGVIVLFGTITVLLLCILHYYEHTLRNQQEKINTTIQLLKLKRKTEIILLESSQIEPIITPMWFGEENSSVNITTIISPSCKHCRRVVSELLLLLRKGVCFRWNVLLGKKSINDSELIKIWVQRYLSDKNQLLEDLQLWSNEKIQDLRLLKSIAIYEDRISEICNDFNRQVESLKIAVFPQIILNDRLLSPIYTSIDLKYILTDMSHLEQ